MHRLHALLEIIRYPLFAIPIAATLPGALIASEGKFTWRVSVSLAIATIGYFAGMMKNDYFHRHQDAIANPHRPIPSNRLPAKQVLTIASVSYILCLIAGFLMSLKAGLLVIGLVIISHAYNAILKERGIWGSISLPVGIGLLSVFGALVVADRVPVKVWYVFVAIALYDFGTHITTTFKDLERDREVGILTTPLQIGVGPALIVSATATTAAFMVAILPIWTEDLLADAGWHYVCWVGIAAVATFISRLPLYLHPSEKNGYAALKGSMVGAITFFPCLIGTELKFWQSAFVILPLLAITFTLLQRSKQEV